MRSLVGSLVQAGQIGESGHVREQAPRTPCFTEGTLVTTDIGPVRIEDLAVGNRVLTRDNGYRRVLWIGKRDFDAKELALYGELQPIKINAGALGPQMPSRDMRVSPHHRMLLTGDMASRISDESEILVPALDLVFVPGVSHDKQSNVTYFHIMFECHEVIRADGCWSESFLPEADVLDQMSQAQRQEILAIFPELSSDEGIQAYQPARLCAAIQVQISALAA